MTCIYLTTPIYYVNDRPHIGHLYTTTIADIVARYHRLRGERVLLTTGTDEHALKVAATAAARGLSPRRWADANAAEFRAAFDRFGVAYDDFIRTSEARHVERVQRWLGELIAGGAVVLDRFDGWYDEAGEEYVPEARAEALGFVAPSNGKPLVRRSEENLFFRLSAYEAPVRRLIASGELEVTPAARRNEILERLDAGLKDIPVSRVTDQDWGVALPELPGHRVYVWVDALFNYLTLVDDDQRRDCWPAALHLVGKEILWFHAVIWPALLLALRERPGYEGLALPRRVHAHSHWVRDGAKMSKSLGNFVGREELERWAELCGVDGLRYFLAVAGPLGAADADFDGERLRELYRADLANGVGNCVSRVVGMIERYFDGRVPAPGAAPRADVEALAAVAERTLAATPPRVAALELDAAVRGALELVGATDRLIQHSAPFKLIADPARRGEVATILHGALQALRVATALLWPVMPAAMATASTRLGCEGAQPTWPRWGDVPPGARVSPGAPLFPRLGRETSPPARR